MLLPQFVRANMLNYTTKKILLTVLVAVALVIMLRMFGLFHPAVAY